MKKTIILLCAALIGSAGAVNAGKQKSRSKKAEKVTVVTRTPAEIESEIDGLITRMTLDEKIGQLNQLTGWGAAPARIDQIKGGVVGSILNETDPSVVNRLQKVAVDSTRLGIPLVFARDVIHGFKTIYPIPLGLASTWNPALVKDGARKTAEEATACGVRWTFSPMVDVSRDARWGRIAESCGEDPYLNSVMGVAMVGGYQGDNLADPSSMAACVKHFAGYGASESGKDYNTTWIPENLLRDVYLKPFEACAKAGAATFMCSFNDINGVPSSGNSWLLRDVLRGEWGWDGLMCSDWNSIGQMVPQGVAGDLTDAAVLAANAGVDVDMESYAYLSSLKKAVEEGKVDMKTVDDLVRNVLRLKYRLGLFDNPYVTDRTAQEYYAPDHLASAQKTAEESAVLLTNNGILPLQENVTRIALVGPMADARHDQNGTWCFDMEKERTVTPLEALRGIYGEDNVKYAPGLKSTRDNSEALFDEALAATEGADVIVYCAGEEAVLSGEAHCRADITLPGAQTALLNRLKATGKPVVLVVMAGRPLALVPETGTADATLFTFHGGTMAGPAIANLLTGRANPSGKLPSSLPAMSGQMPLYYAVNRSGRPASGIVLIDSLEMEAGQTSTGCTSFYLDAGDGPAFPFGYGMSYTTFSITDPVLSAPVMSRDGSVSVTARVTNTGDREGAEVVQLYVGDKVSSLVRPVKELKGFEKVTLAPGETRTVTFTITPDDLAFHSLKGEKLLEPGEFIVWVGSDATKGNPVSFTLE